MERRRGKTRLVFTQDFECDVAQEKTRHLVGMRSPYLARIWYVRAFSAQYSLLVVVQCATMCPHCCACVPPSHAPLRSCALVVSVALHAPAPFASDPPRTYPFVDLLFCYISSPHHWATWPGQEDYQGAHSPFGRCTCALWFVSSP